MITLTKEWLLKTIAELEEERDSVPGVVNEDATMALAAMKLALASLEAESKPRQPELSHVIYHFRDWNEGFPIERFKADYVISWMLANYPPAQPTAVSVPDDVSVPLAHAYKELTPTFMRNHIDIFERYGIYPDGSAGIQAMRIALDGMNRRAAMLQGADQAPVKQPSSNSRIGWLRADYQDDNRGLRGNAPLFVLGKKDPSSVWGIDYIPLTANSPVIPYGWVDCSERMPREVLAALQNIARLRRNLNDFCGDKSVIAKCLIEAEEALLNAVNRHSTMLAAAPQQEAKNV